MSHGAGRLTHVPSGDLSDATIQTPGMQRREGVSQRLTGASGIWMGESRMLPGAVSGNHHHGESETAIYVLSGHPVFVVAEDGMEHRVHASPGDYLFVPPFLPHREENPSADETAVVILARNTQESIVCSVPSLVAAERGGAGPP